MLKINEHILNLSGKKILELTDEYVKLLKESPELLNRSLVVKKKELVTSAQDIIDWVTEDDRH